MIESHQGSSEHASAEAIHVMRQVFKRLDLQEEHASSIGLISVEEIEQLVELSWRYQFDKDRSRMKKGLQAMFDHAIQRQMERT
jgi:hypothetical protein